MFADWFAAELLLLLGVASFLPVRPSLEGNSLCIVDLEVSDPIVDFVFFFLFSRVFFLSR